MSTDVAISGPALWQGQSAKMARAVVTARAWKDPQYLQQLVADPLATLSAAGYEVAPGDTVTVLVDTAREKHLVLPEGEFDTGDLLARTQRIADGMSVTLVRESATNHYLIVPVNPWALDAQIATEYSIITSPDDGITFWVAAASIEAASIFTTVIAIAEAVTVILAA